MVKKERIQHPPDSQYGSLKPEIVTSTCEQRITCSISSVLQQLQEQNSNGYTHICGYGHSTGVILMIVTSKLSESPEVEKPRWRPLNFKYVNLCLYTRQQRNPNGYTHVCFRSQATRSDTFVYCPTSGCVVNQRWWPLTGSRYSIRLISACIHDSNTIQTAIYTHVFGVGQHDQTILRIQPDV